MCLTRTMSSTIDKTDVASFFYHSKISRSVLFKVDPLVAGAGSRWVFRVRLNYNTRHRTISGQTKWSVTDKRGVKTVYGLDESLNYAGYMHLRSELEKHSTIEGSEVLRITLGDKVLRDEKYNRSAGDAPLTELLGIDDGSTGDIVTKPLDGNLSVPYFILCSLVANSRIKTDVGTNIARTCHAYSPRAMDFNKPNMCEEVSEWMPVDKEYPEEISVKIKVTSAQGTTIIFGAGSSVTLESKQV